MPIAHGADEWGDSAACGVLHVEWRSPDLLCRWVPGSGTSPDPLFVGPPPSEAELGETWGR
jgi:hypothetical protein